MKILIVASTACVVAILFLFAGFLGLQVYHRGMDDGYKNAKEVYETIDAESSPRCPHFVGISSTMEYGYEWAMRIADIKRSAISSVCPNIIW